MRMSPDLAADLGAVPARPAAMPTLDAAGLDLIFRAARTHARWQDRPVPDATLQAVYDVLKWGPTSANTSPARFAFIRTREGKDKLRPALSAGNVAPTMAAPVTVIIAHDPQFYEDLPRLFPQAPDARGWFATNPAFAEETAVRNGTLQGAYLVVAARALGLDAGPMSGFDKAAVDAAFFGLSGWRSNFLVNLGYGERESLAPRGSRLHFDEACRLE